MSALVIDCPTGLAGDMLLSAVLDLGVPESVVHEPLHALGLAKAYGLNLEESQSGGLRGLRLSVSSEEANPPHRRWLDLRALISEASLSPSLKTKVLQVFQALADAEATVHGCAPDQVHFHEIGAIDSLVDVIGVCAGIDGPDPPWGADGCPACAEKPAPVDGNAGACAEKPAFVVGNAAPV